MLITIPTKQPQFACSANDIGEHEYDLENVFILEASEASEEAKAKGLKHGGFGRWYDDKGNLVYMSVHGKLLPAEEGKHVKRVASKVKRIVNKRIRTGETSPQLHDLITSVDPYHRAKIATKSRMVWNKPGKPLGKKEVQDHEKAYLETIGKINKLTRVATKAKEKFPAKHKEIDEALTKHIEAIKQDYRSKVMPN